MAAAVVQGSALLLERGAASEAAAELEAGLVRALTGFVLRVDTLFFMSMSAKWEFDWKLIVSVQSWKLASHGCSSSILCCPKM